METPAFFLISVCLRKTHYFFRSLQRLRSHTDQNLLTSYHCFFTTTCLECCILLRLLKKHKTPIALYLPLFLYVNRNSTVIWELWFLMVTVYLNKKKKGTSKFWQKFFKPYFPPPVFFFPTACIDFSWRWIVLSASLIWKCNKFQV